VQQNCVSTPCSASSQSLLFCGIKIWLTAHAIHVTAHSTGFMKAYLLPTLLLLSISGGGCGPGGSRIWR
jgi:hypothetical protein